MDRERIAPEDRASVLEAMLRSAGITGVNAEAVRAHALEEPPETAYDAHNLITWAATHILTEPRRILRARAAMATFTSETEHRRVCPVCRRTR